MGNKKVTPHAGVWIETIINLIPIMMILSLPMRECGLKHFITLHFATKARSLPMRECGLKLTMYPYFALIEVTPHAGVWIETWY